MDIAEALHVCPSVLYNPSNAVTPASSGPPSSGGASPASLDQDCEALLRAYRDIHDPEERQRLLALVRAAAE